MKKQSEYIDIENETTYKNGFRDGDSNYEFANKISLVGDILHLSILNPFSQLLKYKIKKDLVCTSV